MSVFSRSSSRARGSTGSPRAFSPARHRELVVRQAHHERFLPLVIASSWFDGLTTSVFSRSSSRARGSTGSPRAFSPARHRELVVRQAHHERFLPLVIASSWCGRLTTSVFSRSSSRARGATGSPRAFSPARHRELVVRQAHHERFLPLVLSLSKDEPSAGANDVK